MSTINKTAYSIIDGHDELTTAIETIANEQATNNRPTPTVVQPSFVDLAIAGEPFPEDVTSTEEERLRTLRNQSARDGMLKAAKKELDRRRTEAVQDHADKALAYLAGELGTLVAEVVDVVGELGSSVNVQNILERGTNTQIKAYREVKTLVDRYVEIRETQFVITRQCVEAAQIRCVYEVGLLRNSLDESAFWQEQRSQAYTTRASQDRDEHVVSYNDWLTAYEPAKHPHKRAILPVTQDQQTNYLLDLCANHELWVPAIGELLTAWEAANSAAQPVSYDRLKGMEESRSQFYAVTKSNIDLTTGGKDDYRKIPKKRDLLSSYMGHIGS